MGNISENIKNLRTDGKMTQAELAERLGVNKATVSAYENGVRLPSYDVLIRLARIFRVSVDNLLGFSNVYVMDVSELTAKQRNTVQEIVDIYTLKNNDMIEEKPNIREMRYRPAVEPMPKGGAFTHEPVNPEKK